MLRANAILAVVGGLSLALSWAFGAHVLAALGLMLTQVKLLGAKIAALSAKTVMLWLKAQGVNFARVEIAKRWVVKSLIPLLIGATAQRRIANALRAFAGRTRHNYRLLMRWYRTRPPMMRAVILLTAIFAVLALAVASMRLWLLLFSVQMPLWILAGLSAFWQTIWRALQKLVFRTIAFTQLYRVWGFLRRRLPEAYLQRLRRFNFRVARVVVRRRRMTVAQLHDGRRGLSLRLALLREYFRHARPERPTRAEFEAMRRDRQAAERESAV